MHEHNAPPDGTANYRNKMRSFYLNLKAAGNPALREGVVSGEISVKELYEMDPKVSFTVFACHLCLARAQRRSGPRRDRS